MSANPPDATAAQAPRPSVLSLAIKEKAALYAAYMPFLRNGGMFVPTSKPYQIGDEIYLILALMDDPNKYPIAGTVPGSRRRAPTTTRRKVSACISRPTNRASAPASASKKSSAPRCGRRALPIRCN